MQLFRRRYSTTTRPEVVEADRTVVTGHTEGELRRAYDQGRRDERSRRRGHPVLAFFVFVVAVIGAGLIFLAAREGSFTRGGQVVDTRLASAADRAGMAGRTAANELDETGRALRQDGQSAVN